MRVETIVPLNNWRAAPDVAKAAESAGYDGIGTAEIANDPFTPLALAALATERIRLSTGIVVAFPRSPMVMAQIAWDLQQHSRGRFALGLGSQVKGHIVPLRYEGEHYRLTLMTPEFSPRPSGLPPVPVMVVAVGPDMIRMSGRVCDGVRLHGFCTRTYLEEVALPRIEEGLRDSSRDRSQFEIWGGGFIATGADEEAVRKALEEARTRVAFYGSTRTYARVFSVHGLEDLGAKLHRLSVEGKWKEMPEQVSDDVLGLFVASGTYDTIAKCIDERFGGLVDVITLPFAPGTPEGVQREIIQDVKRVPSPFGAYRIDW